MHYFYADDGRIIMPPKEFEPRLKGAFPAFSKLLGQCNLGVSAEEVTSLVIPYYIKERFDTLRKTQAD